MATKNTNYKFLTEAKNPNELGMLGPYRVIDELGRGGMGFVFRAEDTRLQRSVALKVMNEKIAATKNSRTRFISEARAMAAVHHDNVATIFEVGEKDGTAFMAMEMLQGETLEAFKSRKERPGFEEVIDIATQIARGLAAAHNKGIVHRDIKPANIWVESGSGRVKILDFGLALAQTPVDQLAGRGSVIGTPGYLSPEQARSEPLDNRSDLYSLGVVLYELCTARLPLQAKSVAGQLVAILAHDPKPLREYNADIPVPLADMIHRLLSREPKDRPYSAGVLEEELKQVSEDCHAKSEVAIALNKLQAGLSEVVSKKQDSSGLDMLARGGNVLAEDPFASIPAAVAVSPSPSSGSIPVPTHYANPYAKPANPKATKKAGFDWQAYWPVIAIASAACIAIPIVLYAWLFMGASPEPIVASVDPANSGQQVVGADSGNNKNNASNNLVNKTQSDGNGRSNSGAGAGGGGKNASGKASGPQVVIRTSDGRGADTTIAGNSRQPQGLLPAITLRSTPNRIKETRHGYLRFDLAIMPFQRQDIESVSLTLPFSGVARPSQASFKLYGVTDQLPDDWSESGPDELFWADTPSKKIASLPVIAETSITSELEPADGGRNAVRIESPELTNYIRDSTSDLITVVISGESSPDKQMKFLSRENKEGVVTQNRGPSLLIKAKKKGT